MIKKHGSFGALLSLAFVPHATAQTVVWSEDFDTYETGSALHGQGGWLGWGANPTAGEAIVVDDPVRSAPNALHLDAVPGGLATGGDDVVQVHTDLGLTSGIYEYRASIFIPAGHTGSPYFILLNSFVDGSGAAENWSTQVHFDGADQAPPNQVVADFGGDSLPLVTNEWVDLRVVIDLDVGEDAGDGTPVGSQRFYYGDELLFAGQWRGHVSGAAGSVQQIAATDLFSNTAGGVYYDDLAIVSIPRTGPCCTPSGDCLTDLTPEDCAGMGGAFQGFGTLCTETVCYERIDGVWIVELPDEIAQPEGWVWDALSGPVETCGEADDCDLSPSPDLLWQLTFPRDAEYVISVCDAAFDSVLSLGSATCTDDLAVSDDAPGCGSASDIRLELEAGTYFLALEGADADACGTFTLRVYERCPPLDANPDAVPESEPCGEDLNGGCFMAEPAFEPLPCNTVVRGSGWTSIVVRDTDWYEVETTEPTVTTLTAIAERPGWIFGWYGGGYAGASCKDAVGISPYVFSEPCSSGEPAVLQVTLEQPGKRWLFVAPQFVSPVVIECGDLDAYEFTFDCDAVCTPASDGDTNGDGFTDFADLLNVIARWGACPGGAAGCLGDVDCTAAVDFVDLLTVLGSWNPPP